MGSPLGPTLDNTFLNECPSQFKLAVYRRYVCNAFVLFKSKEHLKLLFNCMNTKHKNIKFTLKLKI